ncbi:MAG: anaerobic ribonucleoside-triphosphate reductase activating protein [Thermoproteota archaeon]
MRIKGFVDTSFVDWDGKIVSTLFVPTCNFRCPFCFNHRLILHPDRYPDIPESTIMNFLDRNRDFLDGVCISGGEPMTARGLREFCRRIKSLGLKIKLDTNGSNPKLLKELVSSGLVNYVAMDVKAPPNDKSYKLATGTSSSRILDLVKESVSFLINSGIEYEFRTTVVPSIHSAKDIEEIAKWIRGARLYVLQKFQPENAWDKRLRKLSSQSDSEMEQLAEVARDHLSIVRWRGR